MKPGSWVSVLLAMALAATAAPVHAADSVDETAVADALVLHAQGRFVEAHRAFEPPAAAGSASAQYHLGLLYARGEGVGEDFAQAAVWFTRAAEQDHGHAQFILGHMFARGEGWPRDPGRLCIAYTDRVAVGNGRWQGARRSRYREYRQGE